MITANDCVAKFGMPDLQFERTYMTIFVVTSELKVPLPALPNKIYCNKLLVTPLWKALNNIIDGGFAKELKTWDGCFNVRKMRGGNSMSLHSWGIAVDLNAQENALGSRPLLSAGFVKCFKDAGFNWGGDFKRLDGMHMELASL